MEFRILGPLEVRSDHGAVVTLGGRKPRAVLAVLLLNANESVSPDRLARALWGDDAPSGAVKTVQVHVSRLRKALGNGEVVTTTGAGYRLRVQPGELDVDRFQQLVEDGRSALAAGRADDAAAVLRRAGGLWRGPPLADLAFEPFAQTEIARLEEQKGAALELRVEADVAAGRHAELISELRHLVAEHPSRERLVVQLMLALYRCGRQTEALDAYRDAHRRLAEEIGVEPGPELRAMQEAVLHQDPELDLKPAADLPHELEAAATAPIAGREDELAWLEDRWAEARAGARRLVVLAGPRGMGKTRVAAELARAVHREGASVIYASGVRPGRAFREALDGARTAAPPLLVVADDADRAGGDVLEAVGAASRPRVLVLATATTPEALAALEPDGVLFLKRLGSAGIGTIAALYASDQIAADVPVERLLQESQGVPSRVHDAASRWARGETTRRVEAIAGRAAEGREELRSIEHELAGSVFQLQTAPDWVAPEQDDPERVVCPFKGLASFEEDDAPYFFGREQLVAELVARLVGAPLLGVVGPSGSGKSSVVRAGLLPALADGVLPGSDRWRRIVIRPGEHPLDELRSAIDEAGAARFVLAVDQFEEMFTICRDEDERAYFVSELVRMCRGARGAVVVAAIRADFYGRCASYPGLADLLAANHVLVGSMRRAELARAVREPAQKVGLYVEADLVEALVRDVEAQPGALPLLSTALLELWQRRDGRRLRLATYDGTGGVQGAVARLAEDGFARLEEPQQALARTVLLRLAAVEREGGVERRRLPIAELDGGGGDVTAVIERLADARLLTVSEGTVEFAHEALLREWPRLHEWIEDNRDDLRVHRTLSVAGADWQRLGRDEGALYRGARLAEAREWAERADPGPTETAREFLTASLDRARRDRRARRRNLTIAFGALALGIVVIGAVALVAINQRQDAERQRNIATSRALALQSEKQVAVDPELGLRLALWAYDTSPTSDAGEALREAAQAFHQLAVLPADSEDANAAAYSPDGKHVVTGGADGRALVWDAATRRTVSGLKTGGREILAARYSPQGDRIALGLEDGSVLVTDGSLGAPRVVLHVKDAPVNDLAFTGDGRQVAAALGDGTVRLRAVGGGGSVQRLDGNAGAVLGVDVDRDGKRVVSAGEDGSVRLWHVAAGGPPEVLRRGPDPQNDVAFSPDGTRLLSVGDDGWIRSWRNGRETRIPNEGRQLKAVAFSADGDRFAAGGNDGITRVWSVAGGPPVAVLSGQRSRVLDLGFGATSDRVVSAGFDGTARLWDAGRTRVWQVPSKTFDIDINQDGLRVATSSADGMARVWGSSTARPEASLSGPAGYTTAKFSPADDTLVVANADAGRVRIWPVGSQSAKLVVKLPKGSVINSANFDATGKRIVYADGAGAVVVQDLQSGREVRLGGTPKVVWGAEFTPDGRRVVAVPDRDVLVWRLDQPQKPERRLQGHRGPVTALAFSHDGRMATAGSDGTVRVWDAAGRTTAVLRGHQDEVTTVLFTADGSKVISTSQDGTLRLFDSHTGTLLAVLQSAGELYDVGLSRDGTIATLGKGELVRVFPCSVCGSIDQVRAGALARRPRMLTPQERQQFLAAAG